MKFYPGLWTYFYRVIYKLYTAKYKIKEIPYTQKIDEIVSN